MNDNNILRNFCADAEKEIHKRYPRNSKKATEAIIKFHQNVVGEMWNPMDFEEDLLSNNFMKYSDEENEDNNKQMKLYCKYCKILYSVKRIEFHNDSNYHRLNVCCYSTLKCMDEVIKRFDKRYNEGYYDNDDMRPDYDKMKLRTEIEFFDAFKYRFFDGKPFCDDINFDEYDEFNKMDVKEKPTPCETQIMNKIITNTYSYRRNGSIYISES